jgi:hypothetical protein
MRLRLASSTARPTTATFQPSQASSDSSQRLHSSARSVRSSKGLLRDLTVNLFIQPSHSNCSHNTAINFKTLPPLGSRSMSQQCVAANSASLISRAAPQTPTLNPDRPETRHRSLTADQLIQLYRSRQLLKNLLCTIPGLSS